MQDLISRQIRISSEIKQQILSDSRLEVEPFVQWGKPDPIYFIILLKYIPEGKGIT